MIRTHGKRMGSLTALALAGMLILFASRTCAADRSEDPDEQFLRDAKVGLKDEDLLAFIEARTGSDEDLRDMAPLVRKLGAAEFRDREQSQRRLVALGPCALATLRKARSDGDAEVRRRAGLCIEEINKNLRWGVPYVVVRQLVKRNAPGTVEALLRYLPYELDEGVVEEIVYGLDRLTSKAGAVSEALAAALVDKEPARRAAAACIVGRLGSDKQRESVRKLLKDPAAVVRLRAAQGLLAGEDKSVVPVLIGLLEESPMDVAWQAEEALHWVAGEEAVDIAKLWKESRRPGLLFVYTGKEEESNPTRWPRQGPSGGRGRCGCAAATASPAGNWRGSQTCATSSSCRGRSGCTSGR